MKKWFSIFALWILSASLVLEPVYGAGILQCLWEQMRPARSVPEEAVMVEGIDEAYDVLIGKGYLLTQNAGHIAKEHRGGTCASTAMVNTLLAVAERLEPGVVSQLPKHNSLKFQQKSIRTLQQSLLKEMLETIERDHLKSGTDGIAIEDVVPMFRRVYNKHFQTPLPKTYAFRSLMPHALDVLDFNPAHQAMILSSTLDEGTHAIVAVGRLAARAGAPSAEKFQLVISDPHEPSRLKTLPVYEHKGEFYLSDYGAPGEGFDIIDQGQKKNIKAGRIRTASLINFKAHQRTKNWNGQLVHDLFPQERQFVDIDLVDGTSLRNVSMRRPEAIHGKYRNHVFIDYIPPHGSMDEILFREIADIRVRP